MVTKYIRAAGAIVAAKKGGDKLLFTVEDSEEGRWRYPNLWRRGDVANGESGGGAPYCLGRVEFWEGERISDCEPGVGIRGTLAPMTLVLQGQQVN